MRAVNRASTFVMITALALLLSACSTPQRYLLMGDQNELSHRELSVALAENPIRPGENIRIGLLRKSDHASVHLVQVRHGEIPHIHQTHDLTVFVVRGNGEITVSSTTKAVHEGDVIHV